MPACRSTCHSPSSPLPLRGQNSSLESILYRYSYIEWTVALTGKQVTQAGKRGSATCRDRSFCPGGRATRRRHGSTARRVPPKDPMGSIGFWVLPERHRSRAAVIGSSLLIFAPGKMRSANVFNLWVDVPRPILLRMYV